MTLASAYSWSVIKSGAGGAAWNMALDEALLEAALTSAQPVLRFYGWTEHAASFGYFQKYSEIQQMTLLRPLVRRPTGGGLVPHDTDWTYSVAFPPHHSWYALKAVESYQRVHEWIQTAFALIGVATELALSARKALPGQCFAGHEKSDVLWHGKKNAGAAQRRTRDGLLIQGSIQPPPINLSRADWEQAMCEVAVGGQKISWVDFEAPPGFQNRVDELVAAKYSRDDYNRRR